MQSFNAIEKETGIEQPFITVEKSDFKYFWCATQESAIRLFNLVRDGIDSETKMKYLPFLQREIYRRSLIEWEQSGLVDFRFHIKDGFERYLSLVEGLIQFKEIAFINAITGEAYNMDNMNEKYTFPDHSKWIHISLIPGCSFTNKTYHTTKHFFKKFNNQL